MKEVSRKNVSRRSPNCALRPSARRCRRFSENRDGYKRDEAIAAQLQHLGYEQRENAQFLGVPYTTVSQPSAATKKPPPIGSRIMNRFNRCLPPKS
jgi:hypothetical protein